LLVPSLPPVRVEARDGWRTRRTRPAGTLAARLPTRASGRFRRICHTRAACRAAASPARRELAGVARHAGGHLVASGSWRSGPSWGSG